MTSVEGHAILTRVRDMARSIVLSSFLLGVGMIGTAAGQTAVEAGLSAARAATTTAPAAGIGKAMKGLAGSLDKLKEGQQGSPGGATTVTTVRLMSTSTKNAPKVASNWEDPSGIQAGLSYAELVRRFGPPAMEITGEMGKSLTYAGKAGTFQLEVRDDKVASVEIPKS
jgi:hypothetical protein